MSEKHYPLGIIVCVPIFNDWTEALELIRNIKLSFPHISKMRVVLIDDGSTEQPDLTSMRLLTGPQFGIEIIKLMTNIGHQRAIAIGLSAIDAKRECDAIVVMDGDGEDDPTHIGNLLNEIDDAGIPSIVLARRSRRTEGLLFRVGYNCFKILHRTLTGISCDVGNFSAIPSKWLKQLTHSPELWNHYAATVISSRIPTQKVNCSRSHRYSGQSKMNITSLVVHGLRAISVLGETVGVRVGIAIATVGLAAVVGLVIVVAIRLGTVLAIPGWATSAVGILLILCANLLILTAASLLFVLGARSNTEFIPARDWKIFVADWIKLDE